MGDELLISRRRFGIICLRGRQDFGEGAHHEGVSSVAASQEDRKDAVFRNSRSWDEWRRQVRDLVTSRLRGGKRKAAAYELAVFRGVREGALRL